MRRNSTHGPSGTATAAPTASPAADSPETAAGPACSTMIAISGNAPNPSHEPAFGLTIDVTGPNFGTEPLLDAIAAPPRWPPSSASRPGSSGPPTTTCGGWPVRDPVPVYPHSLIWHGDNPHPALAALRKHLGSVPPPSQRRHLDTGLGIVGTATPPGFSAGRAHPHAGVDSLIKRSVSRVA